MNKSLFISGICVLILLQLQTDQLSAQTYPIDDPVEILFIGSSYFTYNDLPGMFKDFAEAGNKNVYIDRNTINGLYLDDHLQLSSTIEKINSRFWDYIILQGVGSITAYPSSYTDHKVYPALEEFYEIISNKWSETKMVFCMPWAFEDGMTWLQGWTDTYTDMQLKIYNNTLLYASKIGFYVSPVGWAWNTILKEKKYPLHYLHMSDWNHPSYKGTYVMAGVLYSTVFNESSVSLDFNGELNFLETYYFRTVSSEMVLDHQKIWNPKTNSVSNSLRNDKNAEILSVFPNPFYFETNIRYKVDKDALVEIRISDITGKLQQKLVRELKTPGEYIFRLDNSILEGGIYFCSIMIGEKVETKKIILIK